MHCHLAQLHQVEGCARTGQKPKQAVDQAQTVEQAQAIEQAQTVEQAQAVEQANKNKSKIKKDANTSTI